MKISEKEMLQTIKKEKVEFLYLLFTDITGHPKKVTIRAEEAGSALKHGEPGKGT